MSGRNEQPIAKYPICDCDGFTWWIIEGKGTRIGYLNHPDHHPDERGMMRLDGTGCVNVIFSGNYEMKEYIKMIDMFKCNTCGYFITRFDKEWNMLIRYLRVHWDKRWRS